MLMLETLSISSIDDWGQLQLVRYLFVEQIFLFFVGLVGLRLQERIPLQVTRLHNQLAAALLLSSLVALLVLEVLAYLFSVQLHLGCLVHAYTELVPDLAY